MLCVLWLMIPTNAIVFLITMELIVNFDTMTAYCLHFQSKEIHIAVVSTIVNMHMKGMNRNLYSPIAIADALMMESAKMGLTLFHAVVLKVTQEIHVNALLKIAHA